MVKRRRKTHTSQLSIGFMNTCTHKSAQEIYIHTTRRIGGAGRGGNKKQINKKSFHSIIYIMPAAIPINNISRKHTHTHNTHAHTHTHTSWTKLTEILFKQMSFQLLFESWKTEFFWEIKVENSRQWGQRQRMIFCQRSPDRSEELKAKRCQESAAF